MLLFANVISASRKVVAGLCVDLAETINELGPGFLEGREYIFALVHLFGLTVACFAGVDSIAQIALQVLDGKAMCQQDPDQEEDEETPEEAAEYDSILVSSAGDVVAALANALGSDFASAFEPFFTLISKYYVSSPLESAGDTRL